MFALQSDDRPDVLLPTRLEDFVFSLCARHSDKSSANFEHLIFYCATHPTNTSQTLDCLEIAKRERELTVCFYFL